MLGNTDPISFIVTTDRERAKQFYGGTLGLTQTAEDQFALVYDLNGIMFRVTTMPGHVPAPQTVLGWKVTDIAATVTALRDKGVEFTVYDGFGQDEMGIWSAPDGARIAWFPDPDGNTLSLTQF